MTTEEFRELTVRIPEKAARRLDRAAKRNRRPPEVVAAGLIAQSLAVDITEIDFTIDELFERMSSLTTEELRRVMQATLRPTEKRRLSRLLQVNRERTLTAAEDAEIDALLDRVNDVAMERAAAMKLLQDRLVACPTCGALPTERGLWPRAK